MHSIASIPIDASTLTAAFMFLYNLWQAFKVKNYKEALRTTVDAIELAASHESNPKRAVRMQTVGTVAGKIIDKVVAEEGLKQGSAFPFSKAP